MRLHVHVVSFLSRVLAKTAWTIAHAVLLPVRVSALLRLLGDSRVPTHRNPSPVKPQTPNFTQNVIGILRKRTVGKHAKVKSVRIAVAILHISKTLKMGPWLNLPPFKESPIARTVSFGSKIFRAGRYRPTRLMHKSEVATMKPIIAYKSRCQTFLIGQIRSGKKAMETRVNIAPKPNAVFETKIHLAASFCCCGVKNF